MPVKRAKKKGGLLPLGPILMAALSPVIGHVVSRVIKKVEGKGTRLAGRGKAKPKPRKKKK
jgi:hypothetical protein